MGKKRNDKKHLNQHHRKPRSLGGNSSERNISSVCRDKHACWHRLFHNYNPLQIAIIINNVWLDPDWELVAIKRKPEEES